MMADIESQASDSSPIVEMKTDEIDIISPEDADAILDIEIEKLAGEGWKVKKRVIYGARLAKERDLLDLRVDLLGKLERTYGVALIYGPDVGRMVAWMVLLAWLLVALTFASVVGLI